MMIPANPTAPPRGDRGDDTRQRLVAAAIEIFGRHGFEGASTRMLSAAAGANQAAIPYHFGSKEGLYIACAGHIAARFRSLAEPVLGPLEARIAAEPAGAGGGPSSMTRASMTRASMTRASMTRASMTREEARTRLADLLETVAGVLVREESAPWARFIVREQMEPTEAFERLYDGIMKPILAAVSALVGRILDEAPASGRVRMRAVGLIGQLVTLRAARTAVLRHLGWEDVGAAEFEEIRALIRANVAALRPEDPAP